MKIPARPSRLAWLPFSIPMAETLGAGGGPLHLCPKVTASMKNHLNQATIIIFTTSILNPFCTTTNIFAECVYTIFLQYCSLTQWPMKTFLGGCMLRHFAHIPQSTIYNIKSSFLENVQLRSLGKKYYLRTHAGLRLYNLTPSGKYSPY